MKHGFKLGEAEYDVGLSRSADGYRLHIEGDSGSKHIPFNLFPGEEGGWVLHSHDEVDHLHLAQDGDDIYIHLDGETYHLQFEHALQRLAQIGEASAADIIKATMPGSLLSLAVEEGDAVKQGQNILVMESMKMETSIVAPRDAVIETIHFAAGQTFDKDAILITLQAEEGAE
ncbi:MAG: biotin/lipoyl-containing protein [Salinisphaeraceae bacterium]|nr:biotin/lipoyl-containing protein [Salinisphaeraceae bacterium]